MYRDFIASDGMNIFIHEKISYSLNTSQNRGLREIYYWYSRDNYTFRH